MRHPSITYVGTICVTNCVFRFDYILVETTGVADPGPVVEALWVDDELGSGVILDSVITVVDSKHILLQLSEKEGQECASSDKSIFHMFYNEM